MQDCKVAGSPNAPNPRWCAIDAPMNASSQVTKLSRGLGSEVPCLHEQFSLSLYLSLSLSLSFSLLSLSLSLCVLCLSASLCEYATELSAVPSHAPSGIICRHRHTSRCDNEATIRRHNTESHWAALVSGRWPTKATSRLARPARVS